MDAKRIIQKINIFSDFSSLILPVVIGFVAAVVFVLGQLMGSTFQKQVMQESVNGLGGEVQSLLKKAGPRDQYKVESQYQSTHEADKEQIADFARRSTQRELLSYSIFPKPKDTSKLVFQEFGSRYCDGIENLLAGLNAGDCPTEEELNKNIESSRASRTRRGMRTQERSSDDVMARLFGERMRGPGPARGRYGHLNDVDSTIRDVLCEQKAKSASVYAIASDVSGYDFWKEYKYYEVETDKAVEDCWHYQLAYWITEDAVDTIKSMNSGSQSVIASPVKRLMSLDFASRNRRDYRRSSRRGKIKASEDRPTYIVSPEQVLAESCTYRKCDDEIDVVHFNFAVVINSKMILPFMREVCIAKEHEFRGFSGEAEPEKFAHNQITIIESRIQPIEVAEPDHELHRYGDDAVVKLELTCEYIFRKIAYDGIKPQVVKDAVAKAQEQRAQASSRRRTSRAGSGGAAGDRGRRRPGGSRGQPGGGASQSRRSLDMIE